MKEPTSSATKDDSSSAVSRSLVDATAGATAGAFARTVVAPIDRVKLLVQLRGSIANGNNSSCSHKSVVQHKGAWQVFRAIIREEGLTSLWRGNAPTILIEACSTALNFVFLGTYKRASTQVLFSLERSYPSLREDGRDGNRKRRILQSFVSGGLAGATTITFVYPLGFMRTRLATDVGKLQCDRKFPNGMRDVVKTIWRTDGFRGFYKGYGIALISVSMHRLVWLGGYDFLMSEYKHRYNNTGNNDKEEKGRGKDMQLSHRFVAAQFCSMAASTIHYPLDSVRRRLMMQAGKSEQELQYRNTIHCFRRVWSEEGWRGFYRGLGPNLVRCIGSALVLVTYDEVKRLLT